MATRIKQPEGMPKGKPNCGVVAVATALHLPYDKVWQLFAKGNPARWQGRTTMGEVLWHLVKLGGKYEDAEAGRSLKGWVEWHTVPNTTYVVHLGGHWVVVRDGIVVDQEQECPVADYKRNRKRVLHAFKIVKRNRKEYRDSWLTMNAYWGYHTWRMEFDKKA